MTRIRRAPAHVRAVWGRDVVVTMATFPKSRRLLTRGDFARVQRRSSTSRGSTGVVLVHARGDDAPARLGIVASKKVGGAVQRNRAKRLIREWFRATTVPAGLDLVILAHEAAAGTAASALAADLDAALARACSRLRRPRPERAAGR
ncbi:MAG: ribonuclease P protein component [Deltaproteobacteria bacterium]|nr:ribonuclease P protein component [Deltaproteobacteria bacterium]